MNKKLKVLIVGPAWPLRGGLATYDERLCREFIHLGHDASILSFKLQYPKILFPGKTQYSQDPEPDDINIYSYINSINPLNWIFNGLKIKKQSFDLVIFRYWMSFMAPALGTLARIIGSNKHTKIVAITDNIVPHEKRFFDNFLTSYFLRSCNGFVTMSREVFKQIEILEQHKPRLFLTHPLYDSYGSAISKNEAKKLLGLDPNFNYILFFGFIRKYKGLGLLLDSFASCNFKKYNLKLLIAGEFYEDATPYMEQISKHAIEDWVILRNNFIPNNQVVNYFCACDMVVQTYLSATQSGVTQIAYFYNKPVLVTNVGGLAELVIHNKTGYVCNLNKFEIADCINDFYENNKAIDFEKAVASEKQKFSWTYFVEELVKLHNTL